MEPLLRGRVQESTMSIFLLSLLFFSYAFWLDELDLLAFVSS